MKATQLLHNLGQSIWLDNITRDLLNSGTLKRYIDELSVTGLTSNPTIFDHAIKNSKAYDVAIREDLAKGKSGEALFFDLALEDLTQAADLFRPIYDRTDGVDGWVSLEVSPLLAYNTASTLAAAKELHARARRPNLLIKIPGTKEGLPAIEEAIFAGVPINVTLLFSREHYVAAAEAFLRGIERRIDAGLTPEVTSNDEFYVVNEDVIQPDIDPAEWRLSVGGLVDRPLTLTYEDLKSLPVVERYQTLECISNKLGGHLMSNAAWVGVPVAEILDRAGIGSGAVEVAFGSAGGYSDSMSVAKALDETTLIAFGMNDFVLPRAHGFPARVLGVGTYGMKNPKWLTNIEVVDRPYQGFWEQRGWSKPALVKTTSRIDTPEELVAFRHGGILPYVVRQLVTRS